MDVDINTLIGVIGIVFAGFGVYATVAWQKVKTGLNLFTQMFNQDAELLNAVNVALQDDKVTEAEFRLIFEKFQNSAKATRELLQQFKQ